MVVNVLKGLNIYWMNTPQATQVNDIITAIQINRAVLKSSMVRPLSFIVYTNTLTKLYEDMAGMMWIFRQPRQHLTNNPAYVRYTRSEITHVAR